MANACGIKIAVNGSVTDTDVEADSATWVSKLARVRITGGGGSWTRRSQPFLANLDFDVPLEVAYKIRTVTLAVTLDATTASTLPTGTVTGTPPYRIVFNGHVAQAKGALPTGGPVQIDFVEDVQLYLSRRADVAAANNSGIRLLLGDIATAHGDTINGSDQFPDATDFPNCDRPAQKGASNGDIIRTMLTGTGINISSEWEGTITAPAFRWRPDYYDVVYSSSVDAARRLEWEAGYPWQMAYPNLGNLWNDFVSRIYVTGLNSASDEKYGWARLHDVNERAKLGHANLRLRSFIDNSADCGRAARRLIAFQGEPGYSRMSQVTIDTELMYRTYLASGAVDPEIEVFTAAILHPGDLIKPRDPFNNTHTDYGNWPATSPVGGALYDTLGPLWTPLVVDDTYGGIAVQSVVRTVTREYTKAGGWVVTYGIDPHGAAGGLVGTDIADYASGTWGTPDAILDTWAIYGKSFQQNAGTPWRR